MDFEIVYNCTTYKWSHTIPRIAVRVMMDATFLKLEIYRKEAGSSSAHAQWDTNGVCIVYQFPRYQGLVGTTRELRDLNIREGLEFKS